MCGIATNTKPKKAIEDRFSAKFSTANYTPIVIAKAFANHTLPIITQHAPGSIQLFEWGLLPDWAKGEEDIKKLRTQTINARAETIFEKPSFREGIVQKRCLILVDGFIEYQHIGTKKQAYHIQLQHMGLFAMAGIYSHWRNTQTNEKVDSFSIVTVPANALMSEIHNSKKRMPLILHKMEEQEWLQQNDVVLLDSFFKSYPTELMKATAIDNKIGKQVANCKDEKLLNPTVVVKQGTLF